jgi:hypothetical protein
MRHVLRIVLLGALVWGAPASDGYACDCGGPRGPCGAAVPGATVFIGRALPVVDVGFVERSLKGGQARFEVERSLKGTAKGVVSVATGQGSCSMGHVVGERYLVYAYPDTSIGTLAMNACSRTRPLHEAVARADLAFFEERLRSGSPNGLLTGAVIDATRHGRHQDGQMRLEGRRVTVRPAGRRPMHTLSGPQGRFQFTGIPAGRFTITADVPDTFKAHVPFPEVMPDEWPSCVETVVYAVAQAGR